jgi:hypothetical protein
VHVNVHARFLAPRKGGVAPGDLFVGVSDGARVAGIVRHTASASASAWATPVSASVAERELAADSVVLARKAAGHCASERACAAGAEAFEVLFSLGQRTSLAAVARGNHAAQLGAAGIELADDLRQAGALSVVLHAGGWDHAYELGAIDVRVSRLERDQSLTQFASAAEFVAHSTSERFASLWHAQTLGSGESALFDAMRQHALSKDGCGVAFRATPPLPGVAYGNLVALPLLGEQKLRRDRQYVVHVSVAADTNTPRNQLLVGIADGLESGAHVVGFARGDRTTAPVLGSAFGGLLTRNGDSLYIESGQFVARDSGTAGASMSRRFDFDVIVGGGSTRVVASAQVQRQCVCVCVCV